MPSMALTAYKSKSSAPSPFEPSTLGVSDAFIPRRSLRRLMEIQLPDEIQLDDDEKENTLSIDKENLPSNVNEKSSSRRSSMASSFSACAFQAKHKRGGITVDLPSRYYTKPSAAVLEKMSSEELSTVKNFIIGHEDHGHMQYVDEIDLCGIVLNVDIVKFGSSVLEVYPLDESKPKVGQGLNKRAYIVLKNCWPLNDEGKREPTDNRKLLKRYEKKLKKCAQSLPHVDFREYDSANGHWKFAVDHF
jgi:hypothetical protein